MYMIGLLVIRHSAVLTEGSAVCHRQTIFIEINHVVRSVWLH